MSTSTAGNPILTGKIAYGNGLPVNATSSTTASAPTSTVVTLSSPKHHVSVISQIYSKHLNQNITKIPATHTTSRHDNVAGFIVGITSGGFLFILICIAFVCIIYCSHPYNRVTPSTIV